MAVRRCKKEDLKRIARATGGMQTRMQSSLIVQSNLLNYLATTMVSLANLEGEESFEASLLGTAETVVQERVCDDELILIKG